jgi:kumamolisin
MAFARKTKLTVIEVSAARRTAILSGTVSSVSRAFGVFLTECQHNGASFRGRKGPIFIPADLREIIEGVFGLDNRPQAKPHFRKLHRQFHSSADTEIFTYTPLEVAELYDFPRTVDGSGQCIGLIELGGGGNFSDLSNYWRLLKIRSPHVTTVSVGSGNPKPSVSSEGVMLDIEVAGSIAPGAKIVAYFAENTDAGFLNAVTTAVHDSVNNPSIICISWGSAECTWTRQAMSAIHRAFEDAAAIGVTVCVAAGDDGGTDGVEDGKAHVDFPASSPFALACGGTHLRASGKAIVSESVWNQLENGNGATGGGISSTKNKHIDSYLFPLPSWQSHLDVPPSINKGGFRGRGVPDVAGNADPQTGYSILANGRSDLIGGTGAVASLWSGLIALINQIIGKPLGYINPFLAHYTSNPKGFNNITSGHNGKYRAGPGWNACTGLGTPRGNELAALFSSAEAGEAQLSPAAPHPSPVAADAPSTATQKVDFTLTAPAAVAPRVPFELFVWAHESGKRQQVLALAREELGAGQVLTRMKGPFRISSGTTLSVQLRIPGAVIEEPEDTMVWDGESTHVSFVVTISKFSREAKCYGSALVYANGVRVVKIPFLLSPLGKPEGLIEVRAVPYKTAFASYATADRDAVLGRIQGIKKVVPNLDVFLDVLSLRSGQNWEKELWRVIPARDIFYLFWSTHARKSKWVEKEWRCALRKRGIEFIDPIPLESPDKSPPPPALSSLHFNDWTLAFRRGKP